MKRKGKKAKYHHLDNMNLPTTIHSHALKGQLNLFIRDYESSTLILLSCFEENVTYFSCSSGTDIKLLTCFVSGVPLSYISSP